MPEEKDHPASGITPEVRKPTVIGVGQRPTPPAAPVPKGPTVIGGGAPARPPQPTAMPGSKAQPPQQRPAPTIISSPTRPVPQPLPAITQPTAVMGTQRKGVDVSIDELEKHFPGTPRDVLELVRQILRTTIPQLLTDAECVRWGEEEQRKFSELTERSLSLVDAPPVQESVRHAARLQTLLREIGEALAGKATEGLFRRRPQPREEYEERKAEIAQLRAHLNASLPVVVSTEAELTGLTSELTELERCIHGESLAAHYLSEVLLDKGRVRAIQALMDRSVSLMQTVANIQQSRVMRQSVEHTLGRLTSRIQNVLLNELPSWIESITIVFQQSSQTPTDLYTLRMRLEGIVQRLN